MSRTLVLFALVASLASYGCGSDSPGPSSETDAGTDANSTEDMGEVADLGSTDDGGTTCGGEVSCIDQSIVMLDFFDTVSPATITEEGSTEGEFTTFVDASGGGLMPTQSFVYARFTDTGLEKVEVDDEASVESSEWDIAMRRYVVRLNSGVSGPSCVQGARVPGDVSFDTVTSVPDGLTYHVEEYFTASCDFVADGSGIGAPGTVLSSFWTYPGCVAMSGNIYVVALANGRHVKLQVLSYYSPAVQEMCDTMGTTSMPSGAGSLRIRWAFLD